MAQIKLDPDISIADLKTNYPELADILIGEYGFHCVDCFIGEFETLREGAAVHGIKDQDFDELMNHLEQVINTDQKSVVPEVLVPEPAISLQI